MDVRIRRSIVAIVLALISAHGSADSPPLPETGTIRGLPVEGLRYTTPTQSGLTNASGEFHYLRRERVTFSVGSVVIGTTFARPQLSLFDIAGMRPPRTESRLRAELGNPKITAFDRVVLSTILLLVLDNDQHPRNGINLGQWDDLLRYANINLNVDSSDPGEFVKSVLNTLPDFFGDNDYRISSQRDALWILYDSLNIKVPMQAMSLKTVDSNGDGESDEIYAITYDPTGNPISEYVDQNNDGVFEYIRKSTFGIALGPESSEWRVGLVSGGTRLLRTRTAKYQDAERILTSLQLQDFDNDGAFKTWWSTVNTYDDHGRLRRHDSAFDNNSDGVTSQLKLEIYDYDLAGNLTHKSEQSTYHLFGCHSFYYNDKNQLRSVLRDCASSGEKRQELITIGYDETGSWNSLLTEKINAQQITTERAFNVFVNGKSKQPLLERLQRDQDLDGEFDFVKETAFRYLNDERPLSKWLKQDTDGDNELDYLESDVYFYDEKKYLIRLEKNKDTNADQNPDYQEITIYTNDENGWPLQTVQNFDNDADGVIDKKIIRSCIFDIWGNCTDDRTETDLNADGSFDSVTRLRTKYDERGNQLLWFFQNDRDADGIPEENLKQVYGFDENGFRNLFMAYTDEDGDGTFDRLRVGTATFDKNGNQLRNLFRIFNDLNAPPEYQQLMVSTYGAFNNKLTEESRDPDSEAIRSMTTFVYDVDNRLKSVLRRSDYDQDGVFITESTVKYEYVPITDGLRYIYQYFEPGT